MPPLGKQRQFEILRSVLAMAEERHSVPLATAAAAVGVGTEQLRALLAPVLYLEFRTGDGDVIDASRDFLLDEDDDVLKVTDAHWLRDLAAIPPTRDEALRLLIAGTMMESVATAPTPDLDRAVTKLGQVVETNLKLSMPKPPCLPVVKEAYDEGRSLRFRYVRADDAAATDREVLPYRVYCKWGHWYLQGRELEASEPKTFRVDRMHDASLGDVAFDPPPDAEIPEWFDMQRYECTLRLRLTEDQITALPQPYRIEAEKKLADDRVELELVITGERRVDFVLVSLDPSVEILEPADGRERQRRHAALLLEAYAP